MILTRSPFYKEVNWLIPNDGRRADSYTLELFIWTGNQQTDKPIDPTYEITKDNVENSNGIDRIDMARLIDDFIDTEQVDESVNGVSYSNVAVWINHRVRYFVGVEEIVKDSINDTATRGYAYGYEGNNFVPTKILLSDTEQIDVNKNSSIILSWNAYESGANLVVKSYPNNEIDTTIAPLGGLTSNNIINTLNLDLSDIVNDLYLEISHDTEVVRYFFKEEYINKVHRVQYINRYGVVQGIDFYGKRVDKMSVKGSEFESSFAQPNLGTHQFRKYNVNGQSSFSLFTGYLFDEQNPMFKELVLTEFAWLDGLPVNLKVSNIEYKTRRNDKVANYTFDFNYSFNEINTI